MNLSSFGRRLLQLPDATTAFNIFAGVTSTSFGRGFLSLADASSARTYIGVRDVLTANRTYYVRTDGSDSNTGTANTSGGAFLTIQKAFDVICTLDLNGFTITVQIGDGTYTTGLNFNKPWVGGNLVFQGNNATPANVLISVTSANAISSSAPLSGVVTIADMKLQTTTAGTGILHNKGGLIQISNLNFGACTTGHIQCFGPGADILVTGNYTISGGSVRHMEAGEGGRIVAASRTVTLTGTPAFSFAYASGQRLGLIMAQSMTFSGAATGPYYNAINGGGVFTGGGGATYFPGSVAGTATSPGWYA